MPTPMQDQVLRYIRHEVAGGRPFPSTARIAAHMRWTDDGHYARDVLLSLARHGYVKIANSRPWGRSRTYTFALVHTDGL